MTREPSAPAASSLVGTVLNVLSEPDWRARFDRHIETLMFRRLRIASLAFAAIVAFLTAVYWLLVGRQLGRFLPYLTPLGVLPLGMFGLSFLPPLGRYATGLAAGLTLGMTALVMLPTVLNGPEWGIDSVGLLLTILCSSLLFPFSGPQMLRLSAAFLAVFGLGAPRVIGQPAFRIALVDSLLYALVGAAVATVGAQLSHALRAQEHRARFEAEVEHRKAEQLLLSILPPSIVTRLERDRAAIADGFAEVTVLFADLVGFTALCAEVAPPVLLRMLDELFCEFDALTDRHGLEKIKTIGDAYMVAGGLPAPKPDHAQAVAAMALEMRAIARRKRSPMGEPLRLRIGINTGPVIAGVIGTKKFIYDLWGDTVNLAARMESHGEPDAIQVTEETQRRLADEFELAPRGPITVKGRGELRTYLLLGPKGAPRRRNEA